MKKSKFLQNPKDMLSRSFNPAKCKTSLRLAASRLKLLRNKKDAQVKQMKREIAQLLESGQDRTARIRVEHVIREEKIMAAYDLLEIYCELVVSRLPIIESQKNIPIDLKEAIASLVFASPRCGDVPELLDVRKHFTAKYGKDFTTSAIELRPECGVGRMLVEKLSAVAPDAQTKIKILSAIAEEHNVSWDPKSFDEKDTAPPNDLLSGPSTFGKASTQYAEAPRAGDPDIQAPPASSDNKINSTTFNVSQQGPKTLVGTENISFAQNSGISLASQPETKPPGDKKTHLFQDENYESSLDRQRWNMEFKDATAAAEAAAESAERASMAARAAAELSHRDRIMRQNSSSEDHVLRNEGRQNYETSKLASKPFPEDSASKPFSEETEPRKEQTNRYNEKTSGSFKGDSLGNTKEYVQSASLKSKASKDNDTNDHDVLAAGAHSRKNSLKVSRGEMSMKKQSLTYEAETTNDWPEKSENFQEEKIRKQSSINFSRSDSNTSDVNIFADSDDRKFGCVADEEPFVDISTKRQSVKYDSEATHDWREKSQHFMEERIVNLPSVNTSHGHSIISNVNDIFVNSKDQTSGHEVDEDPFVGSKGNIPGEAFLISTHETAAVVFDKSDSESGDGYDFDTAYDEQESVFHMPSKLTENSSVKSDSRSPISGPTNIFQPNTPSLFFVRKNSSPELSENLVAKDGSELDNNMAVKFDYSDGPSSESDDGMNMLGHSVKQDSRNISSTQNSSVQSVRSKIKDENRQSLGSPLREKGYSGFRRKQSSLSSDDELVSEEIYKERDHGKSASPGKLSFRKSSAGKNKEYSGFGRRQASLLSDDELMSEEILEKSSRGKSNTPGKLSFQKSSSGKPAAKSAESQIESVEHGDESNSDSGEGLNFGKLTGGFRHKGYNQPSYLKNRLGGQSSLKKETDDVDTSNVRSISSPAVENPRINKMLGHKKGTKKPVLSSDSDSDSSEEEAYIQKSSGHRKGRANAAEEVNKKSNLGASHSNYGSSNNDSDDDAPEESLARKNHLRSGLSRRTKAPAPSAKPSFPNTRWNESETLDSHATGYRKSRLSDTSGNQQESESRRKNSKKLENDEQPTSPNVPYKPAKSNFWPPPEQPSSAKAAHGTLHESKMKPKSEALDDDASNDRKPVKTQPKKFEVIDSDEEDEKKSTRTKTSETSQELESERKSTVNWGNSERPTSTQVVSRPAKSSVFSPPKQHKVASKPGHPSFSGISEQPNSSKPSTLTTPEPRTSHKSPASEQPSSPQMKAQTSVSNENPKTATLNKTNSNKGDGTQKASHVHPKLPDYDSFVQAFRKNRP